MIIDAIKLNRREFIQGLITISALPSALKALPIELLESSAEAWLKLEEGPTVFVVRDRTLDVDWEIGDVTRSELYCFGSDEFLTRKAVINASEVQPLMWELERRYDEFRMNLICEEEEAQTDDEVRFPTDAEKAWPEIPDEKDIERWITQTSDDDFAELSAALTQWADEEPDWCFEDDYFRSPASGQSHALSFFRDYTELEVLRTLGIKIVEGEFPGSTYYAAELRIPIEEANQRAASSGIPIRFKAEAA